jgi:hypothetical protein
MIDVMGTLDAAASRYPRPEARPAPQRMQSKPKREVTDMAGRPEPSFMDRVIGRDPAEAPKADPTAMKRLQSTLKSSDYNIAAAKMKARYAGQPPTSLTPAQVKALESAERDYRIASIEFSKPREDVRAWDNMPISPGLPPKQGPLGLDWSIAVGRAEKGFVRKSLAAQTIKAIKSGNHVASAAWRAGDRDTLANIESLYEIMNADD